MYVCDRGANRIQVFQKDGTFVNEIFVARNTLGTGVVFDIAFSPDPDQSFIYVADGANQQIHVIRRDGLDYVYNFGDGGRTPGQFYAVHSIATDSHGNIYTTGDFRREAGPEAPLQRHGTGAERVGRHGQAELEARRSPTRV